MSGGAVDAGDDGFDAGSDVDEECACVVGEVDAFEDSFLFSAEVCEDGFSSDGDDGDGDAFADVVASLFATDGAAGLFEEGGEGFGVGSSFGHGGGGLIARAGAARKWGEVAALLTSAPEVVQVSGCSDVGEKSEGGVMIDGIVFLEAC